MKGPLSSLPPLLLRLGLMGNGVALAWLLLRRGSSAEGRTDSAEEFWRLIRPLPDTVGVQHAFPISIPQSKGNTLGNLSKLPNLQGLNAVTRDL
ncbi:hypothetical protein AVMA1855_14015 [Acidovorax sp. SUPP1855]|uniref:hypothetical protein n=1 Tax=Acidovorax sp. SUPP1855 TaxID=431774 RepID=UPI0023DE2CA5|nr:hypothetical protein [Acidovorax sp. SUPP1855]GKS85277.1 hypothetical protein AVMA1855_14015 [Acidovorax sp. SUPP1855]